MANSIRTDYELDKAINRLQVQIRDQLGLELSKKQVLKFVINRQFPDDDACLDWLRHKLFPEKIYCRSCKKPTKHHRIATRKVYGCQECGTQVSPTAGTIFHKSRTPLRLWFFVIFQMARSQGSLSAKQIERETGVTYKTAWRMRKRIRERLGEDGSLFSGR